MNAKHMEVKKHDESVEKNTFPCDECGFKSQSKKSVKKHRTREHIETNNRNTFNNEEGIVSKKNSRAVVVVG